MDRERSGREERGKARHEEGLRKCGASEVREIVPEGVRIELGRKAGEDESRERGEVIKKKAAEDMRNPEGVWKEQLVSKLSKFRGTR